VTIRLLYEHADRPGRLGRAAIAHPKCACLAVCVTHRVVLVQWSHLWAGASVTTPACQALTLRSLYVWHGLSLRRPCFRGSVHSVFQHGLRRDSGSATQNLADSQRVYRIDALPGQSNRDAGDCVGKAATRSPRRRRP
jgi:hypothetical protein